MGLLRFIQHNGWSLLNWKALIKHCHDTPKRVKVWECTNNINLIVNYSKLMPLNFSLKTTKQIKLPKAPPPSLFTILTCTSPININVNINVYSGLNLGGLMIEHWRKYPKVFDLNSHLCRSIDCSSQQRKLKIILVCSWK